jgi:AbrB family looped-hinge helix DNA binding protein
MGFAPVFEVKVSRKRLVAIPKTVAEKLGIVEGMKLKLYVEEDRIVLEPVRDALWFAVHGPKVGYIGFEELEEESLREQEKLENTS